MKVRCAKCGALLATVERVGADVVMTTRQQRGNEVTDLGSGETWWERGDLPDRTVTLDPAKPDRGFPSSCRNHTFAWLWTGETLESFASGASTIRVDPSTSVGD